MNGAHRKTLAAVFEHPTIKTLEWNRLERLPKAAGCETVEGNGSRVRFVYGTHVATFHRPHPRKEAAPYQVEQARAFLTLIGVTP